MTGLRRLAVGMLFLATSAACAPMTVSSHMERGLDVTRYHTFAWGPADALPTGDPRLDRNPFFKDHFEGAVEKQLAKRGFELVNTTPDLMLHYHATIDRRLDVSRSDAQYGYCSTGDCDHGVVEFEAGTLILDVIDAKTDRLIWRGWAQHAIGDELEHPDQLARRIDDAVARMLARFKPL